MQAWNGHKKMCLPLNEVLAELRSANRCSDWRAVLEWELRMDELVEKESDADTSELIFEMFRRANLMMAASASTDHPLKVSILEGHRVELLGKMGRFQEQGEAICDIAENFLGGGRPQEAASFFTRACAIGAAHNLFSVQSHACQGLGTAAIMEGRDEEGVELLRTALAGSLPPFLSPSLSLTFPTPVHPNSHPPKRSVITRRRGRHRTRAQRALLLDRGALQNARDR